MAVRFYDEALFNKIKKWVKDPHMQILKPEETTRLFEIEADTHKDRALQLPLIALSRSKSIQIQANKKQPRSFNALPVRIGDNALMDITHTDLNKLYEADNLTHVTWNVIPMKLNYQLDIYTKGLEEADEYVRNFVFNLINYPKLTVELPYLDLNLTHNATISLEEEITDNSDIKEHLFADEFVRFTLQLSIDDAYMFSVMKQDNPQLLEYSVITGDPEDGGFKVQDPDSSEIVETHTLI